MTVIVSLVIAALAVLVWAVMTLLWIVWSTSRVLQALDEPMEWVEIRRPPAPAPRLHTSEEP